MNPSNSGLGIHFLSWLGRLEWFHGDLGVKFDTAEKFALKMSMFDKIRSFDRRNNEFGWNFVNGYTIPEMIGSISLHFAEAMVFYWWQMWQCPFEFCFFLLQGRVGSSFEQKSLNRGIWWTLSAQRFRSNQFHNFGFLGRLLLPPSIVFFRYSPSSSFLRCFVSLLLLIHECTHIFYLHNTVTM